MSRSSRGRRLTGAALVAPAILLGGCSAANELTQAASSSTAEIPSTTSAPLPTSVKPSPSATSETAPSSSNTSTSSSPSVASLQDKNKYLFSQDRNSRLVQVAQDFGAAMLKAGKPGSSLGEFDLVCLQPGKQGMENMKRKSDGYAPQPGDNCDLTHEPTSSMSIQLDFDAKIGADGQLAANQLNWVGANGLTGFTGCEGIINRGDQQYWNATATVEGVQGFADMAPTVEAAQGIDTSTEECLRKTVEFLTSHS